MESVFSSNVHDSFPCVNKSISGFKGREGTSRDLILGGRMVSKGKFTMEKKTQPVRDQLLGAMFPL